MSDQILLDRIKELERENIKLNKPKKMRVVVTSITQWFVRSGDILVMCAIPIAMLMGVSWLFGGWPTDNFYIHSNNGSRGYCIRQQYDWGKDSSIDCEYNLDKIDEVPLKIEKLKDIWSKTKAK